MNNVQTYKSQDKGNADSRIKVSMVGGTECWLQADDCLIRIWASNWTGREIVRIQRGGMEQVVSDKRSFRFKTPHSFELDGHIFRLDVQINFRRVEVTLHRDGELIDAERMDLNCVPIDPVTGHLDWPQASIQLGVPILGGLAFGATLGYLVAELVK